MTLIPKPEAPLGRFLPLSPLPTEHSKELLERLNQRPPAPESAATNSPPPERAHWLPVPQCFLLNQACLAVNAAFGDASFGCYLVGSALSRRDFRDVDVRVILKDEEFDRLFPSANGNYEFNALWSLVCSSIGLLLQQQTGLPIDFQIQRQTFANEKFPRCAGRRRHALGLFLTQKAASE